MVVNLNYELFKYYGLDIDREDFLYSEQVEELAHKYGEKLRKCANEVKFAKDPRFCKTLEVWLKAGADIEFVIVCLRDISNTVKSAIDSTESKESPQVIHNWYKGILIRSGNLFNILFQYEINFQIVFFPKDYIISLKSSELSPNLLSLAYQLNIDPVVLKEVIKKEFHIKSIKFYSDKHVENFQKKQIIFSPFKEYSSFESTVVQEQLLKNTDILCKERNEHLEFTGERYLPFIDPKVSGFEIHYEHLHRYAFATQFVKGKDVLDMACGEGYGSYMLSKEANYVIGIDIDEKIIKHANNKYAQNNLKFVQGSILEVPLKNKKFDVIVCFEALEHIEEHEKFLFEVKRLLKDNGIFIVSTPNKYIYTDRRNYKNPFHCKELYFEEFKNLLKRYFKKVSFLGQRVFPVSNIWEIGRNDYKKYSEFCIAQETSGFIFVNKKTKAPMYFIALVSNKELPSGFNSFLIDTLETFRLAHTYVQDPKNRKILCSIIIPVYNKIEYTRQCINALLRITPLNLFELVIVNNASTDGTKEYLDQLSQQINNIKVIHNQKNLGFAKACNQGAKIAEGKY
ncbi:MAG: hypothetical protein DRP09_21470, partial [Candidatus Thorarchaeota archaeon]